MAADKYWQLEKEYSTISTEHDFIVRVVEYAAISRTQLNEDGTAHEIKETVPCKIHEFKVERKVLGDNSTYLKNTLYDKDGEPTGEKIDIHKDEPSAIDLWLKLLHGCDVASTVASTSLKGVWDMLATAHRYEFNFRLPVAKSWFEAWYAAHKGKNEEGKYFYYKDYQSLLFPCFAFDHAEGFQQATKYLAYRATGHITEMKPDDFTEDFLRLDGHIMHQVNAARGRLKTILHRALYKPIERLLRFATCACKAETLYAYELALHKTGAWPLESAFLSQSVNEIMNKLATINPSHLPNMCADCGFDFRGEVIKAVEDAREYFDGLCLDCMDASRPKLSSDDEDYWKHTKLDVPWDSGCRISHGQPTWYFSFLGRKMKMTEWVKSKQGHGRGHGRYGRNNNGGVDGVANGVAGVQINE